MNEIKKLEMILESIISISEKTNPGNVAHRIASIKYQARYGLEQLEKIKESENKVNDKPNQLTK